MPSKQNQELLESLKTKAQQAKSIVIADYSGLNVAEQTQLRSQIDEKGGQFVVTKNRLFKLAVTDTLTEGQEALTEALNGPNAFLFSFEDAVSALKVIFDFAADHEALEIKIGILDGKVLNFEATENLSKLPSKPELIGQLISRINGPAYGLVNVLSATTRSLIQALNAIKDQKSAA